MTDSNSEASSATRPEPMGASAVFAAVLVVVRELVRELRGEVVAARVGPESRLENDLGISSLERAELVQRLEKRFGHVPGDPSLAMADTVQALADVLARGHDHPPQLRSPAPPLPNDISPAPEDIRTLPALLAWHARTHPDRVHALLRHDDHDEVITFGALHAEALEVASGLVAMGVTPRDTVAVMLRTERGFLQAFLGTLMAGAIPVPMYPPFRPDRIADYAARQVGILENSGARLLVTFDQVESVATLLREKLSQATSVVTIDEIRARATAALGDVDVEPEAGALIQYTSGSTGDPKGVYLTHDNLLANIRAIGDRLSLSDGDRVVSWLPLYHDMGLIGSWLGSLYFGMPLLVMSPLMFLSRPIRWLEALTQFRGTISPAPNFAFDLCVRRIDERQLDAIDLSSVRLLLNGSEAVLPDTLRRFAERFGPFGLASTTLYPVYGLAECAVGLAAPVPGIGPELDVVSRDALQARGLATPASDEPQATFVSCGTALPRHDIRIVGDDGAVLPDRVQGQVEFRGPSATVGYFRRPEATQSIKTHDGWTKTGDLGYLVNRRVFITGRRKDIIIRAGRNLYPQELEELSGRVPGVRAGCVAAFGVLTYTSGTEKLIIVAETREVDPEARERIARDIGARVATATGGPPDEVHLVRPGAVLKTSSGKVRRSATRDALLAGRLVASGTTAPGAQWVQLVGDAVSGRLRRLGRTAMAAVHTAYLGVLVAVSLPVLCLALRFSSERVSRRRLRAWCRLLVRLSWCRLVVDARHWQAMPPAVFAANHASYLDPVWLLAAIPCDVKFAAKARLATYPVLGFVLRRCGFVLMDKTDHDERIASAGALEQALASGVPLVVFPEGTFVRSPGLLPFRLGAFRAVALRESSVAGIGIVGARDVFPDGAWCVRPGVVTVVACLPERARDRSWQETIRLRDLVRAHVAQVSGELAPPGDPETELFEAL